MDIIIQSVSCNSVHTIKLTLKNNNGLNFCLLLLFTDISPACHIFWTNRYRLSRIELPDSSFQLLRTKRLITRERSRGMMRSLFGHSLSQVDLRDIYAAVDNDHDKLRDFVEILLLSEDTSFLAIDLLKEYCKYRV